MALGGLFGAINPIGEAISVGSAVLGGIGEKAAGGNFFGTSFQVGGIAGGLAHGFGSATRLGYQKAAQQGLSRATTRALAHGSLGVAPELGGAAIGGSIGYATSGGDWNATFNYATMGMFSGGIAQGGFRAYKGMRANSPRIVRNSFNPSPQIIKEAGPANRLTLNTNTYLDGLEKLDDYAKAKGWRIVGKNKNELVHLESSSAYTDIDPATKTIKIHLTAEKGSAVRAVEFADETSHAINAIRGVEDSNAVTHHIRNFADAADSRLIPYTAEEREAIRVFRNVLVKYHDSMS